MCGDRPRCTSWALKGPFVKRQKNRISELSWFSPELLKSMFHTFKDLVFRLSTVIVWLSCLPHKYWWHPVDKRWEGRPPTSQPLWSRRKRHRSQYWLHNGTPVEEFGICFFFQHRFKYFKSYQNVLSPTKHLAHLKVFPRELTLLSPSFVHFFQTQGKDFPYLSWVGEHCDSGHEAGRQRQGDGHGRQLPSAHQKVPGAPLAPVHPGVVDTHRGGHHEHACKYGVVCCHKGAH